MKSVVHKYKKLTDEQKHLVAAVSYNLAKTGLELICDLAAENAAATTNLKLSRKIVEWLRFSTNQIFKRPKASLKN